MKSLTEIISGIRKIRGLPFLLVAAAAGIVLIIISSYSGPHTGTAAETEGEEPFADYASGLEAKIAALLSGVDQAAGSSVMITLCSGAENVYARDENGSGGSEYVIINNGGETAVRLKQLTPKIAGIAVVTKGASAETKLEIVKLLSALLDLPTNKIYVW